MTLAFLVVFGFIPSMVVYLSLRDWKGRRAWQWPPPLGLIISVGILVILVIMAASFTS